MEKEKKNSKIKLNSKSPLKSNKSNQPSIEQMKINKKNERSKALNGEESTQKENAHNNKFKSKLGLTIEHSKEKKEKIKAARINARISEIAEIQKRLDKETPPCGYYPKISDEFNETTPINLKPKIYFKDLALSKRTQNGLNEDKKFKLTPIQRASLPHSLYNRDILGASKTGSGKTIAFVIPVLEKLYLKRWSLLDGLGALVILPTRELAIQIFEVFRSLGKFHDFSLGLVIGGNNIEKEKSSLYNMNILIGTPGRVLQHINETPFFSSDNLQILVIDEADRILDDGFENEINEIMRSLPSNKQTLFFSATLNKNLKAIAKFNLKCPEHISINNIENLMMFNDEEPGSKDKLSKINIDLKGNSANNKNKEENVDEEDAKNKYNNELTPKNLQQFYNLVEVEKKIDVLYSFLNTHKNTKCIVFLSSCKQVRFFYEAFKRMKLGFNFLELHGGQKQNKRTAIFYNFVEKTNSVLFATDIAARGMDFPSINWVIQIDAPEDIQTYIHRVGRTARYKSQGSSLLFLSDSEKEFLKIFESKKIFIKGISINKNKLINLQPILRSILSENPDILYLAQRAVISYFKSIVYQPNKKIFDYKAIDIGKLSLSYGLMSKPHLVIKNQKTESPLVEDPEEEENPKKSKLDKFKEKIKKKKIDKKAKMLLTGDSANKYEDKEISDEEINEKVIDKKIAKEPDSFLRLKRKSSFDKEDKNKYDIQSNSKVSINNNALVNKKGENKEVADERYKGIESELKKKERKSKEEEKNRIKQKHRDQRQTAKAKDYEKHGITNESDKEKEPEDDNDEDDNSFDDFDYRNPGKINKNRIEKETKSENEDENSNSDGNLELNEDKHKIRHRNEHKYNSDTKNKEEFAKTLIQTSKRKLMI